MKLLFLLLFSLQAGQLWAASCCVANTSVPNLMILPSTWQQTFTVGSSRVIGDVSPKGSSTFRDSKNKDQVNSARMDLAYRWTEKYQSGVSFKYLNRERSLNGTESSNSGWSDVGLFQAYQPIKYERTWIFNSINIPTAKSFYDTSSATAADTNGTGTYQAGLGVFHIHNFMTWDIVTSTEVHHSFARTFRSSNSTTEVGSAWGGSVSLGAGYVPWHSKFRYGLNLTPRMEGQKEIRRDGRSSINEKSLVWDSVANITYTYKAEYAFGVNYLDQTFFGPARNTMLNRAISVLFQMHWL